MTWPPSCMMAASSSGDLRACLSLRQPTTMGVRIFFTIHIHRSSVYGWACPLLPRSEQNWSGLALHTKSHPPKHTHKGGPALHFSLEIVKAASNTTPSQVEPYHTPRMPLFLCRTASNRALLSAWEADLALTIQAGRRSEATKRSAPQAGGSLLRCYIRRVKVIGLCDDTSLSQATQVPSDGP